MFDHQPGSDQADAQHPEKVLHRDVEHAGAAAADAGIGKGDVDAAMRVQRQLDQPLHIGPEPASRVRAMAASPMARAVSCTASLRSASTTRAPSGRKAPGGGAADAGSGAGDDGDLAVE